MTKLRTKVSRVAPLAPFNRLEDTAITLYPNGMIGFRKAGARTEYLYPLEAAYASAVKAHAAALKSEQNKTKRGVR